MATEEVGKMKKRFKLKFWKEQFACLLFIIFVTLLNIMIMVFKGQTDTVSSAFSILGGIWISFHLFLFQRRSIQKHIRGLTEPKTKEA